MNRSLAVAVAVALSGSAALFQGCDASKGKAKNATSETNLFSGSSLADTVLKLLGARLKAQASMSDSAAAIVTDAARTKMAKSAAALRLQGEDYENDFKRFGSDLTVGAISSFVNKGIGLNKRSEINNVLGVIVSNTFKQMKGAFANIDDPAFPSFIKRLTHETVSSLDAAGYPPQDIDEAVATIMKSAVSSLKEAGILSDKNGAAVVGAIMQGAIKSLSSIKFEKTTASAALLQDGGETTGGETTGGETTGGETTGGETTGATSAGDTATGGSSTAGTSGGDANTEQTTTAGTADGATSDAPTTEKDENSGEIAEYVDDEKSTHTYEDVYFDDATNWDEFDPTVAYRNVDPTKIEIDGAKPKPEAVYAVIVFNMMQSTIPVLTSAGFSNDQIVAVLRHLSYSVVAGLNESGLPETKVLGVMDEAALGAVTAIKSLNLGANDAIAAAGRVANGAISALGKSEKFTESQREAIVETVAYILSSRINGVQGVASKTLNRAFEQIVADSTQGLANAGVAAEKFGKFGASIVTTVMTSGSQLAGVDGFEFDAAQAAEDLAAVALGSSQKLSTAFSDQFKASILESAAFKRLVGDSFDYQSWFADATKDAASTGGLPADTDPYGDPSIVETGVAPSP